MPKALSRSGNLLEQVKFSLLYKGIALCISFLFVRITFNYLGVERYGVWATLTSVVGWISYFNFGIGAGLQNRLTESLARDDTSSARTYVSTAYVFMAIAVSCFLAAILAVSPFLSWRRVFNTKAIGQGELLLAFMLTAVFFIANFGLSLASSIAQALQKASIDSLRVNSASILTSLIILTIAITTKSSLVFMSLSSLGALAASIALTCYLFKTRPELRPSLSNVDFSVWRRIFGLGLKVFIINIAALIVFTTQRLIIAQTCGPQEVASFTIVNKLYNLVVVVFGIVVTPFWAAYTDAYARGDFGWLKKTVRRMLLLFAPIAVTVVVLAVLVRPIVAVWLGRSLNFSSLLVVALAVYTLLCIWNDIFAYFVNGIGEVGPQMYMSVAIAVVNIPLAVYLSTHFGLGSSGVVISTIVCLLLPAVVLPLQTMRILARKPTA